MLYQVSDFPFLCKLNKGEVKLKRGNNSGKSKRKYYDEICCFDIETSRISEIEQSVMYIWQFQLGSDTIIGRTWEEYNELLKMLDTYLPQNLYLCIYVHNLSYEFQFLRGIYNFTNEEVFALKPRKIAKCEMYGRFEYRCSYILTNMSLDEFTKKYKVEHQKLPDYDYDGIRYPWTRLTDKELAYCINDVIGLREAVIKLMDADGDNIVTIPLTSTGYVRRDVKRNTRDYRHTTLPPILPNLEQYKLLRWAFRGGDTHCNRWFVGKVIDNVHSYDRQSSYPDVLCNCKFPVGAWYHNTHDLSIERLDELIYKRGKAVLMVLHMTDVCLKDDFCGDPYIPIHKCRGLHYYINDNGRVLKAQELTIACTDIDYRIITDMYDATITIQDEYYCRYGMLPQSFRDCVITFYRNKTEKKGKKGEEVYYMKEKNKLNSIYGMCATDPVKETILFDGGEYNLSADKSKQDLLSESNKKAFIAYQWGVWCTAWARYRLIEGIKLVGWDNAVYWDTDSVKYVGDVDWTAYNAQRIADSKCNGAYATDNKGITQYMGIYDHDGEYKLFRSWGSKKYAVVTNEGDLHITVAGVGKLQGSFELLAMGTGTPEDAIRNQFVPGTVFRIAGGLEAIYNDHPDRREWYTPDGSVPILTNVCLRPSTYTLSYTTDLTRILSGYAKYSKTLNIEW